MDGKEKWEDMGSGWEGEFYASASCEVQLGVLRRSVYLRGEDPLTSVLVEAGAIAAQAGHASQ